MKTGIRIGLPRFDSRGLPEGYDTSKLFEYRHQTFNPASGLESFVHKLMPASIFKSIAFAIDPTARYKVAPGVITPVQRTRIRATASVLDARSRHYVVHQDSYSQQSNYKGIALCSSPGFEHTVFHDSQTPVALTSQPVLPSYVKDTTRRTRLLGSSQGEFEMFKSDLISTPRVTRELRIDRRYTDGVPAFPQCSEAGGKPDYEVGTDVHIDWFFDGHAAVLPLDTYNALVAQEIEFCRASSLKHHVSLLKGISPFTRDYSLLRNAIELRDLPKSILQLKDTMDGIRKVFDTFGRSSKTRDLIFDLKSSAKDIPGEWLSFHFGWRQTYKDLVQLMELPEKMSKKINFLMARSRKATTFRGTRVEESALSGVSGFVYDTNEGSWEFNSSTTSRIVRKTETRLVVNAIFDFPPINVPSLARTYTWYDRAGITPRFIDVYNLTPWTWLFDWFTGCGNYLELMEEINHDPSLINWGLITSHTEGKLISDFTSIVPQRRSISVNNVQVENSVTGKPHSHQSTLLYECQVRQDVASIYDVNKTSAPSSLTAYQHSILGAILAQRSGFSRKGAFRPNT